MQSVISPIQLQSWLQPTLLQGMLRGVEKEGLRMQTDGYLASTPHPKALGSKLTHPYITTDYSESLLELITTPKASIVEMLTELTELHALVYKHLENDELLWPLSMPCMLSNEDDNIPLANYGTSNNGQLKTLYRHGLGLRYGRRMQAIAGLHYNLSFSDELFTAMQQAQYPHLSLQVVKDNAYLGLTRNFKRLSIIVLYLLGASPNVCPCFLKGRSHHLQQASHSLFLPKATALRMGNLGYQNSAQRSLGIQYNDLADYIKGLRGAISKPHAEFTALGIDDENGNPTQINDHILQIENEFYSNIRPKQVSNANEAPTDALENRGIAYIELRAVDLDPYNTIGISSDSAHFLETLALYCLLKDSPELQNEEEQTLINNQTNIVNFGRDPHIDITMNGKSVTFIDWLKASLTDMEAVAQLLDNANGGEAHMTALQSMQARASDPELTPSARLMKETIAQDGIWKVGKQLAQTYARHYQDKAVMDEILPTDKQANYDAIATQSWQAQTDCEQNDSVDFKTFLQAFR